MQILCIAKIDKTFNKTATDPQITRAYTNFTYVKDGQKLRCKLKTILLYHFETGHNQLLKLLVIYVWSVQSAPTQDLKMHPVTMSSPMPKSSRNRTTKSNYI